MNKEIFFPEDSKNILKRGVWATDLHFDAAGRMQFIGWCQSVKQIDPEFILIGGDICNGQIAFQYLKEISAAVVKPIYFVLGNHDFYYGSISKIRRLAENLSKEYPLIQYLPSSSIIELTSTTALIGHDGWSDARAGNFLSSNILLNDYILIDELKNISKKEREEKLNILGSEASEFLNNALRQAFQNYEKVILLTHVPPFREACFYAGKMSDDNWAPHFVNKVVGDTLLEILKDYPEHQLLVLCGHSHGAADTYIVPSLHIIAGESELGNPSLHGLINVN
jgi:predicted MPP superfamily phosphohydrolase